MNSIYTLKNIIFKIKFIFDIKLLIKLFNILQSFIKQLLFLNLTNFSICICNHRN